MAKSGAGQVPQWDTHKVTVASIEKGINLWKVGVCEVNALKGRDLGDRRGGEGKVVDAPFIAIWREDKHGGNHQV